MRLASIKDHDSEKLVICRPEKLILMETVNRRFGTDWPEELGALLQLGLLTDLRSWWTDEGLSGLGLLEEDALSPLEAVYAPLYRNPAKIWGIGLNYIEHAADLSEKAPTLIPASFMKPNTTIIGHGEIIKIPLQSERTTAEAELGLIIGRRCRNVAREDWLSVTAGFTIIIDMTAEDILRQNPRYLTLAKSFDTFFSYGPQLITPDEVKDVLSLKVRTEINGGCHAENVVANMTFPPDYLVSFHSEVMTLLPGDIISTGTPGAVPIKDGDEVCGRITGFTPLVNRVADLKK